MIRKFKSLIQIIYMLCLFKPLRIKIKVKLYIHAFFLKKNFCYIIYK